MNRSSFPAVALVAFVALAGLAGCSKSYSASEPLPADSDAIASITPPAGSKLLPGTTVTFTASVSYGLATTNSATIVMVIEDQNSNPLTTGAQPTATVTVPSGTVNLTGQATIPATGVTAVQVFFPLTPAGATSSDVVAQAVYPVGN